jgi:hypothetical protein
VGSHAGIARKDEPGTSGHETRQSLAMHTMALVALGDVVHGIAAQRLQNFYQQSRGGLTIGIKVTPDSDALTQPDGLLQTIGGQIEIRQVGRRGRLVEGGIEKGLGALRLAHAATRQGFGNQWMAANQGAEGRGHLDRPGLNPSGH